MTKTFTKILAFALLAVTSFTACKKDNDSLSVTKDNLVGTYTVASIVIKATGYPDDIDGMADFEPCEKDDQIVLNADLTAEYKDAGTVCNPAGGGTGAWSVSGSTIDIDGEQFTVKSLTKTQLVLQQSGQQSGVSFTSTTTLNKR